MSKGVTCSPKWIASLGIALVASMAHAQQSGSMWNHQAAAPAAGSNETQDAAVTLANLDYYSEYYNEAAKNQEEIDDTDDPVVSHAACDACNSVACCCPPRRIFIGGVEATFLSPDFNGAAGEIFTADGAGTRSLSLSGGDPDVEDFYVGPRIWLGAQGERWGAVVRYWELNASETTLNPVLGAGDVAGFASGNRFDAYTFDVEAIRSFYSRRGSMLDLSFGVRHASLETDSSVFATDEIAGDLLYASVASSRQVDATGLTMAIAGRRCISPCYNVNLFWSARTSILWGDVQGQVYTNAALNTTGGFGVSDDFAEAKSDNDLFIGELQIGLQWDYALQCAPANAFLRTALEYQYWDANGVSGGANSSVENVGVSLVAAHGSFGGQQMDLIGFTIGTGFTW